MTRYKNNAISNINMKILAFTDIHESKTKIASILKEAKNVDLLVCCGDFTYFGHDTKGVLSALNKLDKPVILIHGNHENEDEVETLCNKFKNIKFIHNKVYYLGNFAFFGHGGGGFSHIDKELERLTKDVKKKVDKSKKLIFLTHAPPYGTKLDDIPFYGHVGCQSITKAILELKPIIHLSGHIHETEGKKDKIGATLSLNPGKGKIITL